MIRECDVCGQRMNEKLMDTYNAGSTMIWICPKCRRMGNREIDMSETMKKRPRKRKEGRR